MGETSNDLMEEILCFRYDCQVTGENIHIKSRCKLLETVLHSRRSYVEGNLYELLHRATPLAAVLGVLRTNRRSTTQFPHHW